MIEIQGSPVGLQTPEHHRLIPGFPQHFAHQVGADSLPLEAGIYVKLIYFTAIQAVLILFVTAERFMAGWKQREEAKKALKGEA